MKLSEARFVHIEGTSVGATVNSAAEAKIAIKEIRQKKREFTHIKRGLLREKKIAERIANAGRKKGKTSGGFFTSVLSTASKVVNMAGAYGKANARMDLARIEEECAQTEEILHNLDTVLIQMEGKLLEFS
jgi:hypothetical protein